MKAAMISNQEFQSINTTAGRRLLASLRQRMTVPLVLLRRSRMRQELWQIELRRDAQRRRADEQR